MMRRRIRRRGMGSRRRRMRRRRRRRTRRTRRTRSGVIFYVFLVGLGDNLVDYWCLGDRVEIR